MNKILSLLLVSLLSAVTAVGVYKLFEVPREVVIREQAPAVRYTHFEELSPSHLSSYPATAPSDFVLAAELAMPAVVNIKTMAGVQSDWFPSGSYSATGSGVVISPDGYIITNFHVIEEGSRYQITMHDKREFDAKLIGTDPSTDLALLRIEGEGFPFMRLGNSDTLRIGEWVLAVGNPFNLESTVTAGIVSAKGRNIDILQGEFSIESFIQTDAVVNPGNSGGALVNTRGELVGINTAIITQSGRYEGYSFAVPSNLVLKVIEDLRDYGAVQRGLLGVGIGEVSSNLAEQLGLLSVEGIHITRVSPQSGADDAGIRKGDILVSIEGNKVRTIPELQELVARYRPGDSIEVEFIREGRTMLTQVLLKNQYNEITMTPGMPLLQQLGFDLRNLSREESRRLNKSGVYVISVLRGSKIDRTDMEPGYVITHINDQKVSSRDELLLAMEQIRGEVLLEGFYEGYEGEYFYRFLK